MTFFKQIVNVTRQKGNEQTKSSRGPCPLDDPVPIQEVSVKITPYSQLYNLNSGEKGKKRRTPFQLCRRVERITGKRCLIRFL